MRIPVLHLLSLSISFAIYTCRQVVPLPDGGDLALDWAVCRGDQYTPIFLILPGLTGIVCVCLLVCVLYTNTTDTPRSCW